MYYKDYIRQLCIVFYKQHVQYHFVFLSAFFISFISVLSLVLQYDISVVFSGFKK